MARSHKAQLLVCHEKINDGNGHWAWCSLKAFAWCYDHDQYVCDIHMVSRHRLHRLLLRAEERLGKT